jgi:tetratricopeptide (TPR) repeat protein
MPTSQTKGQRIQPAKAASGGFAMNRKLLARVALFFSIFAVLPVLKAQQPGANSPASVAPAQDTTVVRPVLTARDIAIDRARIMMAEKRFDAGIQAYEDLLKSEPKNAVFMNMIGIAYLNIANYNQAKKYFDRSAKADKKYPSAVNNLGMVYYQQKNYRRAIREYQRAIAIDPSQSGTHANLGYAYYKTKKYPEAATEFRKALEIDPRTFEHNERVGTMMQDRSVENHGLFFYMMAKEYAQLGDAEHCADYLRKSFDEGYKEVAKAKTDPAFKKVLDDPTVQGVLLLISPDNGKTSATSPGA